MGGVAKPTEGACGSRGSARRRKKVGYTKVSVARSPIALDLVARRGGRVPLANHFPTVSRTLAVLQEGLYPRHGIGWLPDSPPGAQLEVVQHVIQPTLSLHVDTLDPPEAARKYESA